MQLSNIPEKLVLAFATSGGKNTIPVDSQIGITGGAASLEDGFPPLTMTPIAAGGIPPSGFDMNGILFELSAIIRWANAGGGFPYDGTFAADAHVGGYPKGARVMRSDGLGYWFNTVDNNTVDPESGGSAAAGWTPDYQSGATSVAMTNANVTLTPLQYGKPMIVITGLLTTNLNLIFPAMVGRWTVLNVTTGGYTVTAKTAAGTGVATSSGFGGQVFSEGTNVYSSLADIMVPAGASKVGYLPAITGAVASDLQRKGRELVSLFDTMTAVQIADTLGGAPTLDLSTPIQAAFNSGARRIFVPDGDFLLSNVTVPAGVVEITGPGRLYAYANGATVLQLLTDTGRTHTKSLRGGLRIGNNGKTGVTGLKIGSTTGVPSPGAQEAVLYLNLCDIEIAGCVTGIDSQVTMEKTCQNVVLLNNTVGMKLYGDAVNGGGNANSFYGIRFQGNTVGCMIVTNGLALHNNQLYGGTFQGNTVCGLYTLGFSAGNPVSGLYISGAHFEANGSGAATVVIDGHTVKKSDCHFVQTKVTLANLEIASTLNPSIIAETGSVVTLRDVSGYGAPTGTVVSCDATSYAYEYGQGIGVGIKTIESYGDLGTIGSVAVIGAPKIEFGLFRNDSLMPNPAIPLLDNTTGATAVAVAKDASFGLVSTIQFAASVGNVGTNRNYWYNGAGTTGEYFLFSVLVKSSADTVIRFDTQLDGTFKVFDATLKAGKWKRIVVAGQTVSATGLQVYCYPTDSVGATLSFKGHSYIHDTDQSASNDVYSSGHVGVKSLNYESQAAVPTFGTWARGEVVWNSAAAAATAPGWIVTTAGTAGGTLVFKAMAALAA
jgi:hypothetical protein